MTAQWLIQGGSPKLCGSDWSIDSGFKKGYAIQIKASKVHLIEVIYLTWQRMRHAGGTLNTPSLKQEPAAASSQLKAIPLHSGSGALSCWVHNKDSQSNHEKRWVGKGGEKKRWREAGCPCKRESEWELGLHYINPMNSEAHAWLSEVFMCLKSRIILSVALTVWERRCFFSTHSHTSPLVQHCGMGFLMFAYSPPM